MNKICTSIEQSKKLIELGIDVNTADMCWTNHLFNAFLSSWRIESTSPQEYKNLLDRFVVKGYLIEPAWSLSSLLKLIPKHILRKDKIHYGQTYIPSFKWEITPTAIYYTDGNDIMDYVSFRYGENNMELIDAVFEMVCWLKENKKL